MISAENVSNILCTLWSCLSTVIFGTSHMCTVLLFCILISVVCNIAAISIEFKIGFQKFDEDDSKDVVDFPDENTTDGNIMTSMHINHSYYNQWYGSSLADHDWRIERDNYCGIPPLIFVWNHKTGGYFKDWLSLLQKECGAPRVAVSGGLFNMKRKLKNNSLARRLSRDEWYRSNLTNSNLTMQSKRAYIEKRWEKNIHRQKYGDDHMDYVDREMVMMGIRETDPLSLKASTFVLQQNRPNSDYVVIYMIRKPLNVILSGYNYHAAGHELGWTNNSLIRPMKVREGKWPLIECFRNIWNPEEYVIDENTTMYSEYRKGFVDDYGDHEALQNGLYLEFTRFVNCEWPMHIAMYEEIKNNSNDRYKWHLFLRFEWFHGYGYDESVAYLMEQIGSSGDPSLIRGLIAKLDDQNPTSLCTRDSNEASNATDCDHMTRGKYDEDLQTELLMNYDERICGMLRKMTLAMDGKWSGMEQYC